MKVKILTWKEYFELCRENAIFFHKRGWTADKLTEEVVSNSFSEGYFCDDLNDEHDDSTTACAPVNFWVLSQRLLEKLEAGEEI